MRRLGLCLDRYLGRPAGSREFVVVSIYTYCRTIEAPNKGVFHWHLQRRCENKNYNYPGSRSMCPSTCCSSVQTSHHYDDAKHLRIKPK